MGNKRLAINLFSNLIAFGVQFGISFILTPYLINSLGSEAYGFVPLANNFIGYINIITIALNSMASRFLTIEMSRGNTHQAQVYFNSVLMANTILAVVLAVPSFFFVLFIDRCMNVPAHLLTDVQMTFAYALLAMEVSLVFSVYGEVFYIKNRLDLSARRNIEANVLRAVVLIVVFSVLRPKIYYITITMLIVNIYLCTANVHYTHRLTPELNVNIKLFDGKAVKTLLSSGVWNSVNQLSTVLLTTLDLYLANLLVGAQASGEYSIVKTVPNFILALASTLVGVFVPQFTIYYAKKERKKLIESVDFSIKIMGYLLMIPVGFLLVFGTDFFRLWVPNQNAEYLQGLSILTLLPIIVTGSVNTIFNIYTVTNKLRTPALTWIGFGVLNVASVIVLVKVAGLGIWAIPVAALFWGLVRNLTFTPVYGAYCLGLPWHTFYKAIGRGCLCVLTVIAICCGYKALILTNSWLTLIVAGICCSLVACCLNLFIVFNKDERKRFTQSIRSTISNKMSGR